MKPRSSLDLGIVQVRDWDGTSYRFRFGARFRERTERQMLQVRVWGWIRGGVKGEDDGEESPVMASQAWLGKERDRKPQVGWGARFGQL